MAKFITVGDKKFEIVGDGVHDDSEAFKAAMAYAESIGGAEVKLPAGVTWGALPPETKKARQP